MTLSVPQPESRFDSRTQPLSSAMARLSRAARAGADVMEIHPRRRPIRIAADVQQRG